MTTQERGATYTEVFASREFRVLFGSFALLVAGDQVKMLALSALVYARTGSAGLSAATYMAGFLPYIVGGTFLLSLADRIRPRALMVAGELLRVVTCLLLAFAGMPVWAMLVLVLATGLFSPVFGAARSALLPDLLPGDAFVLARSVLNVTAAGAQIGGLAAGGAILALAGPAGALAVTAALSALAAVILRYGLPDFPARNTEDAGVPGAGTEDGGLPGDGLPDDGLPGEGLPGDGDSPAGGTRNASAGNPTSDGAVRETLRVNRALLANPRIRGLLLAQWLPVSLVVGAEAMMIPYLGNTAGLALAAASVGLAAGNFVVGRFVSPTGRERLAFPFAVVSGVPLLAFAVQPGLAGAALIVLLATAASTACQLGLQRWFVDAVPEPVRGQAFGLASAGMMTGQAVGGALVGVAAELTSPHTAIVITGAATVICALALHRSLRPEPS
ncbi:MULTISPECIES: MFS transporter [unclassified Streptosporangium]|uniref:MFS transporter n=1 Tax=unclassified Streptosporangium TaxID=2632669 RepID=UPI002E28CC51|nr:MULTISPECIES: MFS transporter [unclassified Streptosporangium]